MPLQSRSSRIDGLAIFAAATFALGLATIIALDRVGAPGGLVRATGPTFTLVAVTLVGLGARNADLASFMAAGRLVSPFYGALGAVGLVAGIAICLYPGLASSSDPPLLGVFAGIALGATVFGPLLRRFGATAQADLIATRFARAPIRMASAIVIWATAALTAFAGFQVAVLATQSLVTSNRLWAETIVASALILSVTPGGLTGVVACAAASAGAIAMIALVGLAAGWRLGMSAPNLEALAPASFALGSPILLAPLVATTLAVAGFFAFDPAAVASRNAGAAFRGGLVAVILCAAMVAAAAAAMSVFPIDLGSSASNPVAASLIGASILAAALALARVGVQGSSRALGVALANPPRPFPTLASVRLARMRGVQAVVVVGCAIFDSKGLLEARTALVLALALSLALTVPLAALAAIPRVGPASASVSMLVALPIVLYRAAPVTHMPRAAELFEGALVVAAAAFVAGALTCLVAPRRGPAPTPAEFDPFADPIGLPDIP
jgi:hypothetical protein